LEKILETALKNKKPKNILLGFGVEEWGEVLR
jgi:hypothetical protein